ncbi:hypothetical protein PHMEG_0006789 [Phytophthora megakarya]|uniref:SWIM-type domain-containing protein n=1 Tax=Phytophthora megakarya TaxID=4795 RepID=A0A225WNY6_9STRA|nr:hypothetical protein PHMEG_0006789 [Phytophthora megakarya]
MKNYGVFLVATAKDFNNHILPFAFSLVPVENYEHWIWFSNVIKEALGDLTRFTAVSDRQKGLLAAVDEVFPEAGHRFCFRHIKSNINSKVFEKELSQTKPAAATYLQCIDKKHWVKYQYLEYFYLPTYDETTSNLAEQANSWIGNDCRSAKPLDAFALYFRKLSELVSKRRQMAQNWAMKTPETELVSLLSCERSKPFAASDQCSATPCMDGAYNVRFLGKSIRPGFIHSWRLVDLPARECTCGNWQDKDFPCVHPIAASVKEGPRYIVRRENYVNISLSEHVHSPILTMAN